MKSMTGYGAADGSSLLAEISVVVKTVNGRFLESRFHLPKEYFSFESRLKKIVGETIQRGTVDIFIHRRGSNQLKVKVNRTVARSWNEAHRELAKAVNLKYPNESSLEKLASLPQVFDLRERGLVATREEKELIALFKKAILSCEKERKREGKSLCGHLKRILHDLSRVTQNMEKIRQVANRELENKLRDRLRKLGFEGAVDPARFTQELVIYIDKGDINEELERLKEHIQMCQKFLLSRNVQGKKLDFYSQELLREVNTIGSKASYAPLTQQVVEAKGLIEAFKEQVQNIE